MRSNHRIRPEDSLHRPGEQGYLLLGALVAVAIVLIFLSVAATYVARDLKRQREEETVRRGRQYIRAIQLYYRKFGHYPGSTEELEHTNNIRFLRKKYVDPLTGTSDWRLILVGKNKTTVKGFFGQPLTGIANTGLGALAGSRSAGMPGANAPGAAGAIGTPTGGLGAPGAVAAATGPGAANAVSGVGAAGTPATPGTNPAAAAGAGATAGQATAGQGASAGGANTASNTGTSNSPFSSSAGMFMGVGTNASGSSIVEVNDQTAYQDWEFLYDPRLEQLKGAAALNSGLGSTKAGQLGQPATTATPAPGTAPGTPGTLGQPAPGTPGQTAPGSATPDPNQPNPSTPPNNLGVPVQPSPRPPNNVGVPNQP